jgi:hypothetical protein
MILTVDGAHHDEGQHQKQKLREKNVTRESLLSKMASVHSTLAVTPSKTVAPATEADTDFDVLLCIGWCAAWWPAVLTAATVTLEEPRCTSLLSRICSGGDVLMVWAPIKEKATGIDFTNYQFFVSPGSCLKMRFFVIFLVPLLRKTTKDRFCKLSTESHSGQSCSDWKNNEKSISNYWFLSLQYISSRFLQSSKNRSNVRFQ